MFAPDRDGRNNLSVKEFILQKEDFPELYEPTQGFGTSQTKI